MAMVVHNVTRGTVVAHQVATADTFRKRLVGLLAVGRLPSGQGLLLPGVVSVHTFFMRFPIDVLFLDGSDRVVRVVETLRPFRFARGGRDACAVLELPAGSAVNSATERGDQLAFQEGRS